MSDSSYGSVYVEGVTYIDEREIAKRDAEIERLREGERAADAEIERLRGDLAAMSDSVAVAAQALNDEERENERLRGLLREAEKMWPNPGLSTESSQWYKRVREALGE